MRRLLISLALVGSIAGGGAAVASAAGTHTSTTSTSGAAAGRSAAHGSTAPSRAGPPAPRSGHSRHCPNM